MRVIFLTLLIFITGMPVANGQFSDPGGGYTPPGGGDGGTGGAMTATVIVTKSGLGTGIVNSSPSGISCGNSCSTTFPLATMLMLTAFPDGNSTFRAWSGVPCGASPTCSLSVSGSISATAIFDPKESTDGGGGGDSGGGGTTTDTPPPTHPPVITSVTPSVAVADDSIVRVLVKGTDFDDLAVAYFVLGNDIYIPPLENPEVIDGPENSRVIVSNFTFNGAPAGVYDVMVFNSDNQAGTLTKAFTIATEPIAARQAVERILPHGGGLVFDAYSFFNTFGGGQEEIISPPAIDQENTVQKRMPPKTQPQPQAPDSFPPPVVENSSLEPLLIPIYQSTTFSQSLFQSVLDQVTVFWQKLKNVL